MSLNTSLALSPFPPPCLWGVQDPSRCVTGALSPFFCSCQRLSVHASLCYPPSSRPLQELNLGRAIPYDPQGRRPDPR